MPQDETPRITMRRMSDYLTAAGAHQRLMIIQSMKSRLGRRHFAPYYQAARLAIRAHHGGDDQILETEIQRLLRERRDAIKPTDIARIENNLRVISDHRDQFASEQMEHLSTRFAPLNLNGVRITVEPTLSGRLVVGKKVIEANVMVDTRSDRPDDDQIEYVLEMLHRGSGLTRPAPASGAQYWHPASGYAWSLNRASIRRWRDIEDAAHEIALRWPTIQV